MNNLRVALAQTQIELGSIETNLEKTCTVVAEASQQGATLIVFPELWLHGYDLHRYEVYSASLTRFKTRLQELSTKYDIHIFGSVLSSLDGKSKNSILYAAPNTQSELIYDKIHLFRLMHEDRWLSPGNHVSIQDMPWGMTGLAICYDLRFPELHRQFFSSDAVMCIIPAEWPQKRIDHWQTLLRARAIENQMFYLGCNSVGQTGKELFGGYSAVISPWGKTLIEGSSDHEGLLVTDINLDEVNTVRASMSIKTDRRPDIYGN